MDRLAVEGGKPVRTKEFRSRPYLTEEMIDRVSSLVREGRFTRFIGSAVPGTNEAISLKSSEAVGLGGGFSVLGGPSVRELEARWATIHRVDYAVAMNSATSGLTAALMALDVGPGDEVVCSPFSFTASATSIICANAIPVFADIDLETFCLSPEAVHGAITKSTKAIMAIHWNGNAGDFSDLLQIAGSKGLKMVEDAAQTPGVLYQGKHLGTHGDVGVFSLNEPKNIMTGEGGIVTSNSRDVAMKCRLIRNHGEGVIDSGSPDNLVAGTVGYNFRLTELLAEIGVCQLDHLLRLNQIRQQNYSYLVSKLVEEFGDFLKPQRISHPGTYYPYTAGFRWIGTKAGVHRDVVAHLLRSEGVPVASGVARLMSDNPMFQRGLAYGRAGCPFSCHLYERRGQYSIPDLPNSRRLQDEEYLGFFQIGWPNMAEDMDDIVAAFRKIMANKGRLKSVSSRIQPNVFVSGR